MQETNKQYFDSYLNQFTHSAPEEIDFIRPHLTIEKLDKGDFYLQKGEVQIQMGFVYEGLLRRYFINDRGNEKTTGFVKENEFATDYPAFIRQKPTKYFIQCLEPSILVMLPFDIIVESYKKFKNSEMYGRLVAEKVLTILSDRVEGFLFNTAEERYMAFISENPDLMNRISLTHLSSFLGIERQSLSRIRKRITEK
ncbi:Crp/Fnr family transcriptional regulator [Abyssalbus ytuae]|uniref:Crp/Fnr family transcriptional regulator n=1 Tax=Abyssalbus ytuae TaxID=2926907 RepID=A0A9E7A2Z9_9FLAO|nr:Crp/Fnr family transcriptional regulator [Abyssalbus ytuae]UOB18906.1 Crp/Fnr family transcriptional regulator [Abyssalbus ytuae]